MAGGKIDILVEPDTKGFDTKLDGKLRSAVGVAARAGVGIAGALGAAFVTSGFQRLQSIDQAESKLRGLGHTADEVSAIMANANSAVTGTVFGMGEAASVAAAAVAANIAPGKELERVLSLTGDAASIAGVSMSEMGSIFNKVAADGRIQGDVINQLGDKGIPILQLLAEEMGVTAEEARKMASEGQVSFETFLNAIEDGMGGAALEAGETFKGAMDNAWAAVGRVGAAFLDQGFSAAPGIIGGITEAIDKLQPAAAVAGEMLVSMGSDAIAALAPVAETIGGVASAFSGVAGPAAGAVAALQLAKWADLPKRLDSGTSALAGFGGQMRVQQSLAKAAGKEIGVMGSALSVLETRSTAVSRMATAFRDASRPALTLGNHTKSVATEMTGMARVAQTARGNMQRFGGVLSGVASGGMSALKSGAEGIIGVLGGPWGAAITVAGFALGQLMQAHLEAKAAEAEHRASQQELRGTLEQTTGAITDQTAALQMQRAEEEGWLSTATQLGLAHSTVQQAMQGNVGAQREVENAVAASNAIAVEGSGFWSEYGERIEAAGLSASDMGAAMAGNEDAIRRVNDVLQSFGPETIGPSAYAQWTRLRSTLEDTTAEANALRDGVNGASEELDAVQTEAAQQALLALEQRMETTRGALDLVGDSLTGIPDEKTITVESDAITDTTKAQLEELGIMVSEPFEGEVTLTFPDGHDVVSMLQEIGAEIAVLPSGHIEITNDSPEVRAALEELGLRVTELPSGEVVIDSNDEEVMQRMLELGLLVEDPLTGEVQISDNIREVLERLYGELDGTQTAGDHTQSDNVDDTRGRVRTLNSESTGAGHTQDDNVPQVRREIDSLNNRDTSSTHTITTRRIEYWERQGYSRADAGRVQGPIPVNSTGGRFPAYRPGGRHDGYRLPSTGPGTDMVDGFLAVDMLGMPVARLDADEWIINGESSELYHQLLRGINADTPNARAALSAYRAMPGYAEGRNPRPDRDDEEDDRSDERESGVDRAFRELGHRTGQAYQWGGSSIGATDCSGEVGLWQIALQDITPRDQRLGNTTSLLAGQWPDLVPGTSGLFIVGSNHEHMVAQLDGVNIESGGNGVQIGAGATSPFALSGATLFYLPDEKIVGGTGTGGSDRSTSRGRDAGDDSMTDAERERQRLDEMAAESQPRLATSNTELPPDPVASAMLNPVNDPDGVKAITKAGQHTERFELAHNASTDDLLTEFLLWAYGSEQEPDNELARAFNETNDPTGIRSMVEAGVWTGRFGAHYRAGKDSQLVKAVHAARANGGYQTIRLRELQDEYDTMPGSVSEFIGKHVGNAAESITADFLGVLGHDDEFGPVVELGLLLGNRAAKHEQGVDGSGRIVIEDTTRTREPTGASAASGVSDAEADEIQPTGSAVYDPGRGAEQWAGEILRALEITGNPSSWSGPMTEQGDIESGGDPSALGPDSAEGRPAGVWQVKPGTYQAYRDPGLVDDVHDVLSNGVAALRYVNDVYDELPWPTAAGYQSGGPVRRDKRGGRGPRDTVPAWLEEGEFVVSADAARDNEAFLTAINDGHQAADVLADAAVAGGTMAAELGIQGGAALARSAVQAMGPQGMALLPFIEAAESMGGMAVDRLSEMAYQLGDDVVDGAAGSVAQFVGVGGPSTRMDVAASRVPATVGAQQPGAVGNTTHIDVTTRGYDRRDLVAGIREATTMQRWREGL